MAYPLLEDPLEREWTALQPWNPDRGEGALLAFRQRSGEARRRIALRNVPPGRRFDLFSAPSGRYVRTVTSAALVRGLDVRIPQANGARVVVIRPAVRRRRRVAPKRKRRPAAKRRRTARRPARFTG
jgi:hypothetical protein